MNCTNLPQSKWTSVYIKSHRFYFTIFLTRQQGTLFSRSYGLRLMFIVDSRKKRKQIFMINRFCTISISSFLNSKSFQEKILKSHLYTQLESQRQQPQSQSTRQSISTLYYLSVLIRFKHQILCLHSTIVFLRSVHKSFIFGTL